MNKKTIRKPKGHKGSGAHKRTLLIISGRASRYLPLYPVDIALLKAGLI